MAVRQGEVIIDYPDDTPYPSCLMLGSVGDISVHVVFAINEQQKTGIIVTAYMPIRKFGQMITKDGERYNEMCYLQTRPNT